MAIRTGIFLGGKEQRTEWLNEKRKGQGVFVGGALYEREGLPSPPTDEELNPGIGDIQPGIGDIQLALEEKKQEAARVIEERRQRADGRVPEQAVAAQPTRQQPQSQPQQQQQQQSQSQAPTAPQPISESAVKSYQQQVREFEERAGLVSPEKRAGAGALARLDVLSSRSNEDFMNKSQAGLMDSVDKVARALAGANVALSPSDIADFYLATDTKDARPGAASTRRLEDLRMRLAKETRAAEVQAQAAVQEITTRPGFENMTPEQYFTSVRSELNDLPPIQKAQALLVAQQLTPEPIKEQQKILNQTRAAGEAGREQLQANRNVAFGLDIELFRQANPSLFVDEGVPLAEQPEKVRQAYSEFEVKDKAMHRGTQAGVEVVVPRTQPRLTEAEQLAVAREKAKLSPFASAVLDAETEEEQKFPTYEPSKSDYSVVLEMDGKNLPKQLADTVKELYNSDTPPKDMDSALRSAARILMDNAKAANKEIATSVKELLGAAGYDALELIKQEGKKERQEARQARATVTDAFVDETYDSETITDMAKTNAGVLLQEDINPSKYAELLLTESLKQAGKNYTGTDKQKAKVQQLAASLQAEATRLRQEEAKRVQALREGAEKTAQTLVDIAQSQGYTLDRGDAEAAALVKEDTGILADTVEVANAYKRVKKLPGDWGSRLVDIFDASRDRSGILRLDAALKALEDSGIYTCLLYTSPSPRD